MRVTVILVALVTALCHHAPADDKSAAKAAARERKVKVALALAAAAADRPADAAACCREDAAAWDDALKERRPLVIFVSGPCDGLGRSACEAGAVAVKVPEYAGSKEQRILVGTPKADGSGFESVKTLPAKSKPAEVMAAVKAAAPPPKLAPPPPLDWFK